MKPILIAIGTAVATTLAGAEPDVAPTIQTFAQTLTLAPQPPAIWQGKVGEGFRAGVRTLSLEMGGAGGFAAFGGRQAHDFALDSLSYGYMLGSVVGEDRWYRGNWEIRAELFGGLQSSPSADWLVGLTPHLRYNFATGTRWIPFLDLGAGVSATSIGPPDASGTFEFNLQANTGVHWFVRDNLALTSGVGNFTLPCPGFTQPILEVTPTTDLFALTC